MNPDPAPLSEATSAAGGPKSRGPGRRIAATIGALVLVAVLALVWILLAFGPQVIGHSTYTPGPGPNPPGPSPSSYAQFNASWVNGGDIGTYDGHVVDLAEVSMTFHACVSQGGGNYSCQFSITNTFHAANSTDPDELLPLSYSDPSGFTLVGVTPGVGTTILAGQTVGFTATFHVTQTTGSVDVTITVSISN
jgi:hypothetical protein